MDGSRVRAIQCSDFPVAVAWAPHAMILAFATEDRAKSQIEGAVRLVAVS